MKSIYLVSLLLFASSCNQESVSSRDGNNYRRVEEIIDKELYVVRGPLTLSQVEAESLTQANKSLDYPRFSSHLRDEVDRFMAWLESKYREGDEIYYVCARNRIPGEPVMRGYVIIRGNEVVTYHFPSLH